MIKYINMKDHQGNVETIDQFRLVDFKNWKEWKKEIRECLSAYREIYPYSVYVSSRSTQQWRDEGGGL